ncbi:uncharacterized protein FOMMEDRAFT_21364 [Fomitiporia mediterranea MF3/22]|uniref:uncharacterized protein n=1 Tax=Fomitiporia mediterranea (strain MF3/22) TaxID=694068 RepID=UPI0004407D1A|nr:uncharacterized protein FOMMEDRAFT_21364 [Fomitiporia mediterranea MF3/22]EJD00898.1 hypothetical protein FOMMEDRAFT_21364 [Fomitiporia mediterranea MF3/22]
MQAAEELTSLADQDADSTNSEARYLGYAARLRTALRAAHRYVAYTSDVGEAFRPVVNPLVVRMAYGVSWAYLVGDVGFETWKAQRRGPNPLEAATFTEPQRLALIAAKRGTFQAVASMALPALTIHTIVRYAGRAITRFPSLAPRTRAWAPTALGLAAVPFLPYLYDKPVEFATDSVAEWLEHRWYEHKATEKQLEKKKEL